MTKIVAPPAAWLRQAHADLRAARTESGLVECHRRYLYQQAYEKAIKAYQNRGPNLRHGIALDKQVTIILSQTETERPLCGIYFNLSSPYHKKNGKTVGKLD